MTKKLDALEAALSVTCSELEREFNHELYLLVVIARAAQRLRESSYRNYDAQLALERALEKLQ